MPLMDDMGAAARVLHRGYGMLHTEEDAFGVDVHQRVPSVHAQRIGAAASTNACVVHQNVELAVARHSIGYDRVPVVFVRNIEPREHSITAVLGNLRFELPPFVFEYVRDDDFSAFTRKNAALFRAHAVSASRNNRNLAFKPHDARLLYIPAALPPILAFPVGRSFGCHPERVRV